MQLRFLEYLIALDQERHFARAAKRCHVTQPTLSAGIATLEEQLGRRLVDRDRKFLGLTREGASILPWACQIIDAHNGLTAAISSASGCLSGELRIGYVPAALPFIGQLASRITASYPMVRTSFFSKTSQSLLTDLDNRALDAALTYLGDEPVPNCHSRPLYRERFVFLRSSSGTDEREIMDLTDASNHRLCLLPSSMQNRRILDAQLLAHSLKVEPVAIADTFEALVAMVSTGDYATFLPSSYRAILPSSVKALDISPELPSSTMGLLVADRKPMSELASAMLTLASDLPPTIQTHR